MPFTLTAVFAAFAYSAFADTIHKPVNIEEHKDVRHVKDEEATIRQHNAAEEEMPSVTLRRADFKDRRTELSAFSDKKPSVRKVTADRDGHHVVMSVDSDGDIKQEAPELTSEALHAVEPVVCDEGQWQCRDGSGCVRHSVLCDGLADCQDHSDEEKESCAKGNFAQVLAHAARKSEALLDPIEQKRYEIISVPGYIPPPREHYEDFYRSNFYLVKRFPRVTNPNNTKLEVWFVQAPISNPMMARAGATHTGVGFIGRDKHTGEELFRRDYQFWAADFAKTFGPGWDKFGDLEMNEDGERAAFRARAMVTSTRTHGRWSNDWMTGAMKLEKLGEIDGYKFNEVMTMVDKFGHDNKYWQGITVKRHKDVVQPAMSCHEFVARTLSLALDEKEENIWEHPQITMQRTTYEVTDHQMTRDPVRCLAPFVDPIDGVGSVLDSARMYNARFLFAFFMGKKLTLPQRYMADGTALEESDFPAECQEFRIKKIITEFTGRNGVKEEVKAPRVPQTIRNTAMTINKAYTGLKHGFDNVNMAVKEQITQGAKLAVGHARGNPLADSLSQATKSVLEIAERSQNAQRTASI